MRMKACCDRNNVVQKYKIPTQRKNLCLGLLTVYVVVTGVFAALQTFSIVKRAAANHDADCRGALTRGTINGGGNPIRARTSGGNIRISGTQ
jgi:hypothetical protein